MTRNEYNECPNLCKACGKPIFCTPNQKVSYILKRKYCCRECYENFCKLTKGIVGIYCIKNKVNNKIYIGQSTDIYGRMRHHKSELRNNHHKNTYLQNSWNKYGEDNFEFYILEECDIDDLDTLERSYISKYNSMNREYGYNRESGGNAKKKASQETKNKISKNHVDVSGKNNPMYGKKMDRQSIIKTLSNKNYINRKIRGTDSWRCSISEDDAYAIKKHFSDGHKIYHGEIRDIAEKYNTTIQVVSHIKNGHSWGWLNIS